MDGYQMTIISIDPGGKSGVAIRLPNKEIVTCICESIFRNGQETTFDPKELYDLFVDTEYDHVIIETFQAQTIDKYGLHTVRLVGGIEAICFIKNIPITKHMPQMRYPFKDDAKQLLAGKRHMIHELDALAHLLRWEHERRY